MSADPFAFQVAARQVAKNNPEWRTGQAYFNTLAEMRPDIAEQVRGTTVDCFYQDWLIPDFLNVVYGLWDSDPT